MRVKLTPPQAIEGPAPPRAERVKYLKNMPHSGMWCGVCDSSGLILVFWGVWGPDVKYTSHGKCHKSVQKHESTRSKNMHACFVAHIGFCICVCALISTNKTYGTILWAKVQNILICKIRLKFVHNWFSMYFHIYLKYKP